MQKGTIMKALMIKLVGGLAVSLGMLPGAMAQQASVESEAERVSFVACPVYRDTKAGEKSGCWLATDPESGIRYDISRGRTKPQIGRKILVEGKVTEDAENCGDPALEPVWTSVLPEDCPDHMIPAEGYPGNKFELPEEVMQPIWVERELPEGPYEPKTYHIYFDFNSDFLIYQYSEVLLEDIALYIEASDPEQVVITGYAATQDHQVSDRVIAEKPEVARARAEMVATALRRLQIDPDKLKVQWKKAAEPTEDGDRGLEYASRSRATVELKF